MAPANRAGGGGDSEALLAWAIPGVAVLAGAAAGVAWLASAVDDVRAHRPLPGNLIRLMKVMVHHPTARPSTAGWVIAAALVLIPLALLTTGVLLVAARVRRARVAVDAKARHLGRGRDLAPLTAKAVTATAARLGSTTGRLPGPVLGREVTGGRVLHVGPEDTVVVMAGPRTGKSSVWAIPTVLDAPGPVVYTSNKTDDVALMRKVKPGLVFDPQGLTGQPPGFWWDPLSTVVDDTSAARLAGHFADDARNSAAHADAYFDPEGRNLLGWLLLAAAVDARPITAVTDWLADSRDPGAVLLLEGSYPQLARRLDGLLHLPDKQRGGIYGTAARMASCLTNSRVAAWITRPPAGDRRTHFDPAAVLTGTDVLYSLSREGEGSAGALVTALTVAVCEAAEALAVRSPRGRLATPLTAVLDEAANVCRWRALPQLYSHYGSRGIALWTFLQAPEQAEDVWGTTGAGLLWSAANHRIYAGGVANEKWLSGLSQLIGTYDAPHPQRGPRPRRVHYHPHHPQGADPVRRGARRPPPRPRRPAVQRGPGHPDPVGAVVDRPARRRPQRRPRTHRQRLDRQRIGRAGGGGPGAGAGAGAGVGESVGRRGPGASRPVTAIGEWSGPSPDGDDPGDSTGGSGVPARVAALRRRYPRRRTGSRYRPVQLRARRPPVPARLGYGSTAHWAEQVLFPTYRRDVHRAGLGWCPRWWAHPEVIARLEALWRAWEHLRLDPTLGMAVWWKDYADPTMAALLNPAGPFTACRANRHHDRDPMRPLPHEPAPPALFPDVRVHPDPQMWRHHRARR